MRAIRYIGEKPIKHDNVAGTGTVWNGPRDIQEVPDAAVPLLLLHPTVWELATAMPAAPREEAEDPTEQVTAYTRVEDGEGSVFRLRDEDTSEVIDLGLMDDKALKQFARVNLIKADLRKRDDALRADIVAAALAGHKKG